MKIESYKKPSSSFLSIEKDTSILINDILKDEILKKLLFYTDKNPLAKDGKHPNLTQAQTFGLLGKEVRLVPKIKVDEDVKNYVIISFDGFATNGNNPQFRDNLIIFDIVCHLDQWQMPDFQLRPYRIAAQLDTIMTNEKLTNMGQVVFNSCKLMLIDDEFAGVSLSYNVIHGGEDKQEAPVGNDELVKQFTEMFNNK